MYNRKTVNNQEYVLAQLKNRYWHYNKQNVFWYIEALGKSKYGENFHIDPFDEEIIFKLIVHCIKDEEHCKKYHLDTTKGILISGPVGVGKTCLAQLIPKILPEEHIITHVSCRNIAFEYNQSGVEVISTYASIPKICYDDLGVEAPGRYYGKDCNTVAEVILSRYDKFIRSKAARSKALHTTITTNLNATEIEKRYGERVRSRIREMFNLITFSKQAKDKRV